MARRISFGERMGDVKAPALSLKEASEPLRTGIWNTCHEWIFPGETYYYERYRALMEVLYSELLNLPTYSVPASVSEGRRVLHEWVMTAQWYEFYEFVETLPVLARLQNREYGERLLEEQIDKINFELERHGSPYRFVKDLLVPITSEDELAEIKSATAWAGKFGPAANHINEALAHIARRPDPNYEDSVKQSWCAVESALWIAIGDKPELSPTLRRFQEMYGQLHPCLSQVILKLHGYASDEEGVRHAATGPAQVGEAEARMMLVTCSAMMNFIIRKVEKI
jgi:hypothetical protein